MAKTRQDTEAKKILRERWPKTTSLFGRQEDGRKWLRCQPVTTKGITHPRLRAAGSTKFAIQPDGLYALFGTDGQFADVVAIEVCASIQNLNDKRSRYAASTGSLALNTPHRWLASPAHKRQKWWKASRAFASFNEKVRQDLTCPIRHLRVLYFLSNELYRTRIAEIACEGHEYFAPHTSLRSITAKSFLSFLERMSPSSHYYSTEVNKLGAKGRRKLAIPATILVAATTIDDDPSQ